MEADISHKGTAHSSATQIELLLLCWTTKCCLVMTLNKRTLNSLQQSCGFDPQALGLSLWVLFSHLASSSPKNRKLKGQVGI